MSLVFVFLNVFLFGAAGNSNKQHLISGLWQEGVFYSGELSWTLWIIFSPHIGKRNAEVRGPNPCMLFRIAL